MRLVRLISIPALILLSLVTTIQVSSASGLLKYNDNPILSPVPTTWESTHVYAPFVMEDNGNLKMWYSGHNGTNWQIGLATSSDGISWNKHSSNPVLIPNNSDPNENHIHTPALLKEGGSYTIWYTASPDDQNNFTIRSASSIDGINWIKNGIAVSPSQGWDTEGVVWPFVIKVGSEYKMWYTARGNDGIWRMGHATSPDGISWTPYSGNPILVSDESWEGQHLASPSVIYDGSTYHMWYGTNSGTSYSAIVYATSSDGVNWTKPAAENPVLIRDSSIPFESLVITSPSVLQLGGTTALWYGALGNISGSTAWRIGLAADGPLATPSATPTLPPTPTPEPPTPTPTPLPPSPTPTPAPTQTSIVIPGFGASWNPDAIFNCKADDYEGSWAPIPIFDSVYGHVIDSLESAGQTVHVYPYDWRRSIPSHASDIASFVDTHTGGGTRTHLVGHSMGGLLSRAYIEHAQEDSHVDTLVTVGSPHQGIAQIYPAWSAGRVWQNNLLFRIYLTIGLRRCQRIHRISAKEAIRQYIPSAQDLLSTVDYLVDRRSGDVKPVETMHAQNTWLSNSDFSSPFYGIDVGTVVGDTKKTLSSISVRDPNRWHIRRGLWLDGRPVRRNHTRSGDGTVLLTSAQLPDADNRIVSEDHIGIVKSDAGVTEILDLLGLSSLHINRIQSHDTSPQEDVTSALVIVSHPAEFWITDEEDNVMKDTDGIVIIPNPESGRFHLRYLQRDYSTPLIVAQFMEDGRVLWREYPMRSWLPKFRTIHYDKRTPHRNPLKYR